MFYNHPPPFPHLHRCGVAAHQPPLVGVQATPGVRRAADGHRVGDQFLAKTLDKVVDFDGFLVIYFGKYV